MDDAVLWDRIWRYAIATNTINYRQIGWGLRMDRQEVRRLVEEYWQEWEAHPLIDWSKEDGTGRIGTS